MSNVIYTTFSNVGRVRGFSNTIDYYFSTGYLTGGVTWNGTYLFISRRYSSIQGVVNRYLGFSNTYIDYITTPLNDPMGLSMDSSGNLYSTDFYGNKLYKHSGFSSTISSSITYTSGWYATGITIASGNTFAVVTNQYLHRKHQGFTSTVLAEHTGAYTPRDTSWDGTNELGASAYSGGADFLIKYQGFSGTVIGSYTIDGIQCLEWDNHIGQASLPPGWAGTWGPVNM